MGEAVSVLMPVAPRAAWLVQALDGVARQTLAPVEVVVVLDGECEENLLALRSATLTDHLTVLQTGGGAGVARSLNLGLRACSGDLIARHDADDVSAPGRLAEQVEVMRRRPDVGVLGTGARVIDEAGAVVGRRDVVTGEQVARKLLWRNVLIHPSVMMRASVVASLGGYNEESVRTEDYELWLRVLRIAAIDNLPVPLVDYRVHGSQHSRGQVLGPQSTSIRQARREAARSLGRSVLAADARHAAWVTWQRFAGRA